ncbi:MAG: PspC domain-containing protein [Bacteroidaceae bacterium]|nr:PspC domain-containing protein [Bacteroidaceae bacterium]
MKKVITVGIGGRNFTIDEDAYERLNQYLANFRSKLNTGNDATEVMDDLEMRIADLFEKELHGQQVVSRSIVNRITEQIGMPDGGAESSNTNDTGNSAFTGNSTFTGNSAFTGNDSQYNDYFDKPLHKFYLDTDNRIIGGVCAGAGAYLNVDVVVIRVIVLVLFFCGFISLLPYLAVWIIAPKAVTLAQKCELRGIPATAENMARMSRSSR